MSIQRLRVLVALSVVLCSSCTFDLQPIDLAAFDVPDAAAPDLALPVDLARAPSPDLLGDLSPTAPDLAVSGNVLFSLDARSDSVWMALEQPPLVEYGAMTIGHYFFNEGQGALLDSSPKLLNLTEVGGPFAGNRRIFTPLPAAAGTGFSRVGAEFTGAGFTAADKTQFDVTLENFTIETWFKLVPDYAATPPNNGCDPIVQKMANGGNGYDVCVLTGGQLRMLVSWTAGGAGTQKIETNTSFADGAWHLGAFVFNRAANSAGIFVDGIDVSVTSHDLSNANGKSISTSGLFTIGGAGGPSTFHGSLAELVFHDGKVIKLADHQIEYRAFSPPTSPSGAGGDVTYTHASTLCTVVAVDKNDGDRVACYAGGPGLASQFALARSDGADPAGNAGLLGMALAPAGTNYATRSELVDTWSKQGAMVMADNRLSPRADLTADTVTLPAKSGVYATANSNQTGAWTFSVWLRGQNDGDRVYMRVTDNNGNEFNHCLIALTTKKWKRYACTNVFTKAPGVVWGMVDTIPLAGDAATLPAVTVDVWGGQLETSPGPTPYIPNVSNNSIARGEVLLSLRNAGYLKGNAGRLVLAYVGDDALPTKATLFDTGPGLPGRITLRRNVAMLEGELLDGQGMNAADSLMSVAPGSWTMSHLFVVAWSDTNPLAAMSRTLLRSDAMTVTGRNAAFVSGPPGTLFVGSAQDGKSGPTGALQTITIWDHP